MTVYSFEFLNNHDTFSIRIDKEIIIVSKGYFNIQTPPSNRLIKHVIEANYFKIEMNKFLNENDINYNHESFINKLIYCGYI